MWTAPSSGLWWCSLYLHPNTSFKDYCRKKLLNVKLNSHNKTSLIICNTLSPLSVSHYQWSRLKWLRTLQLLLSFNGIVIVCLKWSKVVSSVGVCSPETNIYCFVFLPGSNRLMCVCLSTSLHFWDKIAETKCPLKFKIKSDKIFFN